MRAAVGWRRLCYDGDLACCGNVVVITEPPVHVVVDVLGLHIV